MLSFEIHTQIYRRTTQSYESVQTDVLHCEKGSYRSMKQDSDFSEPEIINMNELALFMNTKRQQIRQ